MAKKGGGFLGGGEEKSYTEIPIGGAITEPGNSREYNVSGWRIFRPVVDKKRCINCLFCWITCPDAAIHAKDGNQEGFDYDHCKGCGICSETCPVKCIVMIKEDDALVLNKNHDFDEQGRTESLELKYDGDRGAFSVEDLEKCKRKK
ncbi:ferredoxin [Candidatus Woesearchaeota archaeon CG_4_10_14_0_8_um_filter_47_5]|nr:MAG: ferredoxin [Candidatus Woesearchaeota archaeon CG_4_10_14_0_8_um_filter_47_5]